MTDYLEETKRSRQNWERMSKMDSTLKVNRELGRAWTLWQTFKAEPWTKEIEDKFASVAYTFFEANKKRTIVDAKLYQPLLSPQTTSPASPLQRAVVTSGIENIMLAPEANDLKQMDYPFQYRDEPYKDWPTLKQQLDKIETEKIVATFNI